MQQNIELHINEDIYDVLFYASIYLTDIYLEKLCAVLVLRTTGQIDRCGREIVKGVYRGGSVVHLKLY